MSQIPVTVLTGYLGAGKTTLLNRILTEPHGKKYAVIVNEFGEIGIDNDLVIDADEEIFEVNNGCICCNVRGDLVRIIAALMKRKRDFDGILVETTGLADPAPVAQTFFADEEVRARTTLDAIVTVADAKHLALRLADSREAQEQIAFADVILLNKMDAVSAGDAALVERLIARINPSARILRTTRCDAPIEAILNVGAFDLARITSLDPHFLPHAHHEHGHDHDHAPHYEGIESVALRLDRPLNEARFSAWMGELLMLQGPDILRAKGILDMGGPERFVFQAVHMMADGGYQGAWPEGARASRLVFIGRDLDAAALRAGLEGCIA